MLRSALGRPFLKAVFTFPQVVQCAFMWAVRGWALVDVCGFRYAFEESAPGECAYRLELLEYTANHAESRCYLDFLRDMGIECIGSYGRWVYLRRRSDGAPFDLFSDVDSKIAHLRRINVLVLAVLVICLAGGVNLLHMREYPLDALPFVVLWAAVSIIVACGFVQVARKLRSLKRERAVRE